MEGLEGLLSLMKQTSSVMVDCLFPYLRHQRAVLSIQNSTDGTVQICTYRRRKWRKDEEQGKEDTAQRDNGPTPTCAH